MTRQGKPEEERRAGDRVPLDEILRVFEQREDRAQPVTASDVMDAVDCSRRTAHNKLSELVDRGILETRKVGSRSRVWWVPIEDEDESGPDSPVLERRIEDIDLPGTGKTLEARRQALVAAYEFLQDHPEAKKSDFQQEVFPDNPAEYETAEGWWNTIQPALAQLPGVDPPEERGNIWHFIGG